MTTSKQTLENTLILTTQGLTLEKPTQIMTASMMGSKLIVESLSARMTEELTLIIWIPMETASKME